MRPYSVVELVPGPIKPFPELTFKDRCANNVILLWNIVEDTFSFSLCLSLTFRQRYLQMYRSKKAEDKTISMPATGLGSQ